MVSWFPLCLMCFSAVSLQAKPIYGGWLLLAPEGTDFDNPVHRSRVSKAEMPSPCAVGGGGRRSGEGPSLPAGVAVAPGVPQAPPCSCANQEARRCFLKQDSNAFSGMWAAG